MDFQNKTILLRINSISIPVYIVILCAPAPHLGNNSPARDPLKFVTFKVSLMVN